MSKTYKLYKLVLSDETSECNECYVGASSIKHALESFYAQRSRYLKYSNRSPSTEIESIELVRAAVRN